MPSEINSNYTVSVLDPVADALSGTVNTDVVKARGEGVLFTLTKGVGTTGTTTITIDACDDPTPSNTTAVVFYYRIATTMGVWSAWTAATASGFTTTAGSSQQYQMYVDASALAEEGYAYVRATLTEVVDDPCVACVTAQVVNTRYQPQNATLLS